MMLLSCALEFRVALPRFGHSFASFQEKLLAFFVCFSILPWSSWRRRIFFRIYPPFYIGVFVYIGGFNNTARFFFLPLAC